MRSDRLDRYAEAERALSASVGVDPIERRVQLRDGGRVRVQEYGEGPPLLFIHGGSIAGASWAHLVARLGDQRCIVIDRPGCGLSDPIVRGPPRDLNAVKAYADRLPPRRARRPRVVAEGHHPDSRAERGGSSHR
ncbi:MAG: alpha/beta hydrolase [Actinomycetota bacterium]